MPEPLVQRRPDTEKAVLNKYQSNPGIYGDGTSPIAQALINLDIERAQRGQNPLSVRQSQLAYQAASTNTAATRPPDQNILKDFINDIRTLTASIPRLPGAIVNEVRALPEAPEAISSAMAGGGSPLDMLSRVAQTPGVRMLPGAFVAGNLNNPQELLNHPLFTGLDVLPGNKIPGVNKVTSRATKAISKPVRPIVDQLATTRPGQILTETFGRSTRDVSQMEAELSDRIRNELYGTDPIDDPLVNTARAAANIRNKYPSISESRRVELTRMMTEDADDLTHLSGDELAFVKETREITDDLGRYAVSQGLLKEIDGELYDLDTASRIISTRRKASIATEFQGARNAIRKPPENLQTLHDAIFNVTKRTDLRPGAKLKIIEGYGHALAEAGMDTSPLMARIREYRNTKPGTASYTDEGFREWWSDVSPTIVARTPFDYDSIYSVINKSARTDPTAARLADHLRRGRWNEARTLAKRIATRKTYPIIGSDRLVDELARRNLRDRYLRTTEKWDSPKFANQAAKVIQRNPPARFQPKVEKETWRRLEAKFTDDPDFDKILPYLRERNFSGLTKEGIITREEFDALQNSIKSTWQEMKDAGFDPVFVHKVSPGRIGQIEYPRVLESVPTPTQTRNRTYNITPSVDDISIALPHQALEWLAMRGSEEFVDSILASWGRSQDDLINQYLPAARAYAQHHPQTDVLGHAQQLMDREWQKYDPNGIITWPSARLKRYEDEAVWIPKTIGNTIRRMHSPPGGRLTAVMDPIMKVFRTSLLPLSPRWHFYNILGGGILLLARTDPSVFRFTKQAIDMTRQGVIPEHVPRGMGTVSRDVLEWNAKANPTDKLGALFHYQGGQTLRRLMDQAQAGKKAIQPGIDMAGKGIQKSYAFNSFVDDMYRTMAYLYGYDKKITKGMSKESATQAGIELARKTMQNWDRMTPIERTIMRYVFPFYGWMNHIIRYAVTYPWDHPFRTAVMGAFARNEIEDMGDALPERFLNTFFLGPMGKDGSVKALNLAGMNPFRDVANYFTLAGFMGQVNPIISALMQTAGIDPMTGGPELFPNLMYDPEVGRLVHRQDNIATNLATSILPQSRVLFGIFDSSSEFQELLRTNPDAAARLLRSQAGLPVIFRDINIPQEIAKAEVARDEAQSTALNASLKSGNWSQAEAFPNLAPVLDSIRQMQGTGQLGEYQPTPGQSAIALAQEALLKMNLP